MFHHDGQAYLSDQCDALHIQARLLAHRYFDRVRRQAFLRGIWYTLSGRSIRLLRLSDLPGADIGGAARPGETGEVHMHEIIGSEGRADDFDCCFAPLREQDRERWVTLAALVIEGRELPPVELVDVGGKYYIYDGHHRISVAQALGETTIKAHIWLTNAAPACGQLSNPLPIVP
ncbi:MAG: ParB N-terminal domain-containing protein [Oscillochloris sp.]|nr:ParB N-terminal domain-containing protein [Oscillochloris sp.]